MFAPNSNAGSTSRRSRAWQAGAVPPMRTDEWEGGGPPLETTANRYHQTNNLHPHDRAADAGQSNRDRGQVASADDFKAEVEEALAQGNAGRNGPEPPKDLDDDGADSPPGDDEAQESDFFDK